MGNIQTITEMMLFSFAILGIFAIMTGAMEWDYPSVAHLSTPIEDNTNSSQTLINAVTGSKSTFEGANVNFDSQSGLTIPAIWGILLGIGMAMWSFFSGSWIAHLVVALQLGSAGSWFAITLQVLWIVVLIGIFVFTFFKVRSV